MGLSPVDRAASRQMGAREATRGAKPYRARPSTVNPWLTGRGRFFRSGGRVGRVTCAAATLDGGTPQARTEGVGAAELIARSWRSSAAAGRAPRAEAMGRRNSNERIMMSSRPGMTCKGARRGGRAVARTADTAVAPEGGRFSICLADCKSAPLLFSTCRAGGNSDLWGTFSTCLADCKSAPLWGGRGLRRRRGVFLRGGSSA